MSDFENSMVWNNTNYPNEGLLEQYSAFRSHLGVYLNVCVTVTYQRESDGSLKAALFRGLGVVIAKHPIHSAIPILNAQTDPRFVRLD